MAILDYYLLLVTTILWLGPTGRIGVQGTVLCQTTAECESLLGTRSSCQNGTCTNPYTVGGCLSRAWTSGGRVRVCNSHDPPDYVEAGYCQAPIRFRNNGGMANKAMTMEVRISGQNWESAFVQAWILQILLSEVLGIPASIETGKADAVLNFYDVDSRMDYDSVSFDWDALIHAARIGGDCRTVNHALEGDPEHSPPPTAGAAGGGSVVYQSCAHVIPEVWYAQLPTARNLSQARMIERYQNTGALGEVGWFIPRFVGQRDPSLVTYMGYAGEKNRQKLAQFFLRPTTWIDYCETVSSNHCAEPDGVARRPPATEEEESKYFMPDVYTGHFRATDDNNCTAHPTTCTGHFVDYPCGWTSYFQAQAYHLQMALKSDGDEPGSNGYTYAQMTEIWSAANATQSNVVMLWRTPGPFYQTFQGTSSEFVRVYMPRPTLECLQNRIDMNLRCTGTLEERVGSPKGICDDPPQLLNRLMSTSLHELTNDPSIPEALRNPGYEAVSALTMSELQVGKILDDWLRRGVDKMNFDLRNATCQWLLDNKELVRGMIPPTYPRVFQEEEDSFRHPLAFGSLTLSLVTTLLILVSMVLTYRQRHKRIMVCAQIEFLWLILVGLLLVALGAIIIVIPPSNASCISVVWLVNIGYTLELVPLIVKVAAINRLMTAAKKMKRVVLKRRKLFGAVFVLTFLVMVYVTLWTILDPPQKVAYYQLTDQTTANDETIVITHYYCRSESNVWRVIASGWVTLLLLYATVLAVQTRNIRSDFNETSILAMMIYSHFTFVLLSRILFTSESLLDAKDVPFYQSLIYSCDTITAALIYFFPKFFWSSDLKKQAMQWISTRKIKDSSGFGQAPTRGVAPNRFGLVDTPAPACLPYGQAHRDPLLLPAQTSVGASSDAGHLLVPPESILPSPAASSYAAQPLSTSHHSQAYDDPESSNGECVEGTMIHYDDADDFDDDYDDYPEQSFGASMIGKAASPQESETPLTPGIPTGAPLGHFETQDSESPLTPGSPTGEPLGHIETQESKVRLTPGIPTCGAALGNIEIVCSTEEALGSIPDLGSLLEKDYDPSLSFL